MKGLFWRKGFINERQKKFFPTENQKQLLTNKHININQKGFANIVLIALVVLVLAGVVGYFVLTEKSPEVVQQTSIPAPSQNQNTPTQTPPNNIQTSNKIADWKTYRSDKYDFEIQYPQDWIVEGFQEQKQEPPLYNSKLDIFSFYFQDSKIQAKQKNFYDRQNMFVGFQMLDPSPSKTIEERACPSNSSTCITAYKNIGGVKAIVNTFERSEGKGDGNKEKGVEFIKDGKLYQFYTGHNGIPQENVLVLANKTFFIDQIVGTFNFIK